jgi:hypothetical protein
MNCESLPPDLNIAALVIMPFATWGLTRLGGARPIMEAKGHRLWKAWQVALGVALLFLISPIPPFRLIPIFFLSLAGLSRSLHMLVWGMGSLVPDDKRAPHLVGVEPRPLFKAGAGLALISGAAGVLWLFSTSCLFADLTRKGNEGAVKGNLGAIRSALSIYYGDMEGVYPSSLEMLTISGKYLPSLPVGWAPNYHDRSNAVHAGRAPDDQSGWFYNNDPKDADFGTVLVNCTHTDLRGSAWTCY